MLGPSREPEKYNGRSLEDDVSMVSPFPSTAVSNSRNVQSENEKDTSQLEYVREEQYINQIKWLSVADIHVDLHNVQSKLIHYKIMFLGIETIRSSVMENRTIHVDKLLCN